MKTLLLVRHAKSSWDFFDLPDFDRPLNERGNKDAPLMAKRLLKNKIKIDLFVTSPAKRAYTTAEHFADVYDVKRKNILQLEDLYEADVITFYKLLNQLSDDAKNVALFSHNPGITDFANSLTKNRIDNLPTSGVFAIKVPIKKWSEFETTQKEFWFFDFPKAEK